MTPVGSWAIENNIITRMVVITITNVKRGIASVPAVFSAFALFHERTTGTVGAQLGAFPFRLNRDIIVLIRQTQFMELFIKLHSYRVI